MMQVVKNMKIFVVITAVLFLFAAAACTSIFNKTLNEGNNEETANQVYEEPAVSNGVVDDNFEEEKWNIFEKFTHIDPPPEESFVLGTYPSMDDEDRIIVVYAWQDQEKGQLKADFVYFNRKEGTAEKITRTELVDSRRTDRRDAVAWLDSERALVNGLLLFNAEDLKTKNLTPENCEKIWDYHVNSSRSALAMSGEMNGKAGVWMIDLDTLHEYSVYEYEVEQTWLEKEMYRVYWSPDNLLYFDVDFRGKPAIYYFDALEKEKGLYLHNATLLSVDQETGEISYKKIAEEEETRDSIKPDENSTPHLIMKAAEKYMEATNRPVGQSAGKIVLTIDNIMEDKNKALVAFGPWASEYVGLLLLEEKQGEWKVTYEKYTHYAYRDNLIAKLAEKEDYEFGDEPGKYSAGIPYETQEKVVILTGPYESYWEREYTFIKKEERWELTDKTTIRGQPIMKTEENVPHNTFRKFFSALKDNKVEQARDMLYQPQNIDKADTVLENLAKKIEIFDTGEARLLPNDKNKASLQIWIVCQKKEEEQGFYYSWWDSIKVDGEWKIIWDEEKVLCSDND